jgi:hypothetical protein
MPDFQLLAHVKIEGVGAASGLIYHQERIFLISDSSSFLYDYQLATQTLNKHALVSAASDHIEKKNKFDLEAICQKNQKLYLFGSGSTSKRQALFCINLPSLEQSSSIAQRLDLSSLYQQFRVIAQLADDELNIEGVVYQANCSPPRWIFLQRGNGATANNGLFVLSDVTFNGFMPPKYPQTLSAQRIEPSADITFYPIKLPAISQVETGFTDGYLLADKLYFLAAAEDTTSTYMDGAVLGSLFGCIDLTNFELQWSFIISSEHKFEGLTLEQQSDQQLVFLLCEDNDTAVLASTLYQLSINL